MSKMLIVGGVTQDTLHLGPNRYQSPGGAGLYTALAAKAAGAEVTLFAQKPEPMPPWLREIETLLNWIGPPIPAKDLPTLEIAHYGKGRAELLGARWGAQAHLMAASLPENLNDYRWIHLAVMVSPERQLSFLQACRQRSGAVISAGTNGKNSYEQAESVRELIGGVDLFFMNENEAHGIFGSLSQVKVGPEKHLFITRGSQGALVFRPGCKEAVPAPGSEELDPTGAGDTFCGTVLAELSLGKSAGEAARTGVQAASAMIGYIGPEGLLKRLRRTHGGMGRGRFPGTGLHR
jgi:sugar/nucleoside kinase (ribokinase family)